MVAWVWATSARVHCRHFIGDNLALAGHQFCDGYARTFSREGVDDGAADVGTATGDDDVFTL
jgi:surface antigen